MKQDSNLFIRPKCKCGEDALIYFGDVPLCGNCAMLLHNYKNKLILNQLEEAKKCLE